MTRRLAETTSWSPGPAIAALAVVRNRFSAGRSIVGDDRLLGYLAYQLTL